MYLTTAIRTEKLLTPPAVYEDIDDFVPPQEENIRVPRHPSKQREYFKPQFNFKNAFQQDPQKIRYAKQQQIDSYLRAYYQQLKEAIRDEYSRTPKSQKIDEILPNTDKNIESIVISDTFGQKKVVDIKNLQRVIPKPPRSVDTNPKEKAIKKFKTYQVSEDIYDQEVQPSQKREARIYYGHQVNPSLINLGPHYLPKPRYSLNTNGFVGKAEIDALSSLIGKSPSIQLQGLNHLLASQIQPKLPLTRPVHKYPTYESLQQVHLPVQTVQETQVVTSSPVYQLGTYTSLQPVHETSVQIPVQTIQEVQSHVTATPIYQPEKVYAPNVPALIPQITVPTKSVGYELKTLQGKDVSILFNSTNRTKREIADLKNSTEIVKEVTEEYPLYEENTASYDYDIEYDDKNTALLQKHPVTDSQLNNFKTTEIYDYITEDITTNPTILQDRSFGIESKISKLEKEFLNTFKTKRPNRVKPTPAPKYTPHKTVDIYKDFYLPTEIPKTTKSIYIVPKIDGLEHYTGKTTKDPTNVIVINNSNDNHNHGSNVDFHNNVKHGQKVQGGHHTNKYNQHSNNYANSHSHNLNYHKGHKGPKGHQHKIIVKKPAMSKSRILRLNQKVDFVLAKLKRKDILE